MSEMSQIGESDQQTGLQNGQRSNQITELFRHVLQTAKADPTAARQVREALLASGLLEVFDLTRVADETGAIDLLDLLEVGGDETLRARMAHLRVAQLHQIITAHHYDPQRETSRWRSPRNLIAHIVARATAELNAENATEEQPALAGTAWLL
jgi:hypothetical protein